MQLFSRTAKAEPVAPLPVPKAPPQFEARWECTNPLVVIEKTGLLFLVGGLGSLAMGVRCYDSFFQCDYVQLPNHGDWGTPAGYTVPQFVALLLGTYLLPLGLMLILVYAVQSYKSLFLRYSPIKALFYLLLTAVSMYAVYRSYVMSKDILDCGIFCIGHDATVNSTNDAAIVSTGVIYFVVCVGLTALFAYLTLLTIHDIARYNSVGQDPSAPATSAKGSSIIYETQPLMKGFDPTAQAKETYKQKSTQYRRNGARSIQTVVALALTFGALYPVFFFACTALPTWWAYFTKHSIQAYEVSRPPKAYGFYWKVAIGDDLVLKLFPDILVYYGTIYIVAAVAMLAQFVPSLAHRLAHKPKALAGVTQGEFILSILLVVLLVGQFCYWYWDHGWENEDIDSRTGAERAARSVGQVANMVTGLLVLPVTRNSVWSALFGVSWESLLVYHQLLGYLLLALVLIHMFLWWKVFAQQDTFPHDIFAVPLKYHKDNFTVPLAMVSTVLMFLVMGGLSLPVVRRLHYDLFYWTHHLSLGLFLMMLWHSTMSWYYIAVGLTLWAADHAIRLYRSVGISVKVESATIEGNSDIVHLSYTVAKPGSLLQGHNPFAKTPYSALEHAAGQYCFINIPLVSQLAWHPFTISSSPDDATTQHHIKVLGLSNDQWTQRLLLVVRGLELQESGKGKLQGANDRMSVRAKLTINVDGPYGLPLDPSPYRCVLLVGGGIGITPLYATFKHFYSSSQGADRYVWEKSEDEYKLAFTTLTTLASPTFSLALAIQKKCLRPHQARSPRVGGKLLRRRQHIRRVLALDAEPELCAQR